MDYELLINNKYLVNKKSLKNKLKDILEIIETKKIDIKEEQFNKNLNSFIVSYIKLNNYSKNNRDSVQNIEIIELLIDELISKVENDPYLSTGIETKIIEIKNNIKNYDTKQSNINIKMKY